MNSTTAAVLRLCETPAGRLAAHLSGPDDGPAVVMTHSLLSASTMWASQAALLARRGFRVIAIDLRGHGESEAWADPCTMDALAGDTVAVMDELAVQRAHYVGLSIGGMSGFGLALQHPDRLLSLCLCDARADTPPAAAALWDERIALATAHNSCAPLAQPTIERWFGRPFLDAHPQIERRFIETAARTRTAGFIGCARAIQRMDYLAQVSLIALPTTLIVGANDGVLPEAMRELQARMPAARLEMIAAAGHLPNIDQPAAFDAALLRHFERVTAP